MNAAAIALATPCPRRLSPMMRREVESMRDDTLAADTDFSRDALFQEVYARLKSMAGRQRAQQGGAMTLVTTELVHELYLRLSDAKAERFSDPAAFFAYAACAMRHLLVDMARRRLQMKAGGGELRISLTDRAVDGVVVEPAQALELDAALRALEADDARAAHVVELHYFAGVPLARIAQLTGDSPRTVDRDWAYARRFLAAHVAP